MFQHRTWRPLKVISRRGSLQKKSQLETAELKEIGLYILQSAAAREKFPPELDLQDLVNKGLGAGDQVFKFITVFSLLMVFA
jgi:hypothetical protein